MSYLLEIDNLSHNFANKQILHDISLKINEKEIITIIGPNGSGKTTLIKIILGLINNQSGIITKRSNLQVGYMPQKFHIDLTLPITVRRFLTLTPEDRNISKWLPNLFSFRIKPNEQLINITNELGINHIMQNQMSELSGGEVQRVLLAYSLMLNPELLIMDEPVQGMDIGGQNKFYKLIERIRQKYNCSILMVSHDLHMVMQSTDRVICINHHICCEGTPEDIREHPEYVALLGDGNNSNLAIYSHNHNHNHDISGEVCEHD